jgi:L-histidine Nalpha-methyltransferase
MHLRSRADQTIIFRSAGFSCHLRAGETIWTESSHKYNCAEVAAMGERAGYRCEAQWIDAEWPFAQSLFIAA